MSTLTSTSTKPWERAWRATARLQGQHESEREQRWLKLSGWQHAQQVTFLNYGESDDRMTRHAMSDRQQDVHWLQVRTLHDRSYIAGILLLAHGLTVKLSPCPCSHSSPAGRIAACLCGHPKCSLLLAQARPRMIQHISSQLGWAWVSLTLVC